jgi:hypothetical protein
MEHITIDLSGPQGNAYYLLNQVGKLIHKHNLDLDKDAILEEMQMSDYPHLLDVFEDNFGQYVTLINR